MLIISIQTERSIFYTKTSDTNLEQQKTRSSHQAGLSASLSTPVSLNLQLCPGLSQLPHQVTFKIARKKKSNNVTLHVTDIDVHNTKLHFVDVSVVLQNVTTRNSAFRLQAMSCTTVLFSNVSFQQTLTSKSSVSVHFHGNFTDISFLGCTFDGSGVLCGDDLHLHSSVSSRSHRAPNSYIDKIFIDNSIFTKLEHNLNLIQCNVRLVKILNSNLTGNRLVRKSSGRQADILILQASNTSLLISDCYFINNSCSVDCKLLSLQDSLLTIHSSSFLNNRALGDSVMRILVSQGNEVEMINSSLKNNTFGKTLNRKAGLLEFKFSDVVIQNCDMLDNHLPTETVLIEQTDSESFVYVRHTSELSVIRVVRGVMKVLHSTFSGNIGSSGAVLHTESTHLLIDHLVCVGTFSELSGGCLHASNLKYKYSLSIKDLLLEGKQDSDSSSHSANHTNVQITVSNSKFFFNTARENGGVIHSTGVNLNCLNSSFQENAAEFGGALFSAESLADVKHCHFHNNSAKRHAGAMYVSQSECLVSHSTFEMNSAGSDGGAMYSEKTLLYVVSSAFESNTAQSESDTDESAGSRGGAVYVADCTNRRPTHIDEALEKDMRLVHREANFGSMHCEFENLLNATLTLYKSRFYKNYVRKEGGAVYAARTDELLLVHILYSSFEGHSGTTVELASASSLDSCPSMIAFSSFTHNLKTDLFMYSNVLLAKINISKEFTTQCSNVPAIRCIFVAFVQDVVISYSEFCPQFISGNPAVFARIAIPATPTKLVTLVCPKFFRPHLEHTVVFYASARMISAFFQCLACDKGYYPGLNILRSIIDYKSRDYLPDHVDLWSDFVLLDRPLGLIWTNYIHGRHCLACPVGADCSRSLETLLDYWAYQYDDVLQYVWLMRCPPGYCCSEPPCHRYDACAPHRTGTLCGHCAAGHTEAIFSTQCLPSDKCTDTWILYVYGSAVIALCVILVLVRDIKESAKDLATRSTTAVKRLLCCKKEHTDEDEESKEEPHDAPEEQLKTTLDNDTNDSVAEVDNQPHNNTERPESEDNPENADGNDKPEDIKDDTETGNAAPDEKTERKSIFLITSSSSNAETNLTKYVQIALFCIQDASLMAISVPNFAHMDKNSLEDYLYDFSHLTVKFIKLGQRFCLPFSLSPSEKLLVKNTHCVLVILLLFLSYLTCVGAQRIPVLAKFSTWLSVSLAPRLVYALMTALLIFYQTIVTVCLSLIHCVDLEYTSVRTSGKMGLYENLVPIEELESTTQRSVLLIDGDIVCFQLWQFGAFAFLLLWVLPFILVLLFGTGLVDHRKISVFQFVCACFFPPPFLIWWIIKLFREQLNKVRESQSEDEDAESDPSLDSALDVLQKSYKSISIVGVGPIGWIGMIKVRRMLLVMAYTFIIHPIWKLACMMLVLVFTLLLHEHIYPFNDDKANKAFGFSMVLLYFIGFVNIMKAYFLNGPLDREILQMQLSFCEHFLNVFMIWIPFVVMPIFAFLYFGMHMHRKRQRKTEETEQNGVDCASSLPEQASHDEHEV